MANTKVEVYNAAMAMFGTSATVVPSELVRVLGPVSMAQAPASKHVWALKKLGFDIQANKNGREVVSYTLISAPGAAPASKPVKSATKPVKQPAPAKQPKAPAPKPAKAASAAPVVAKAAARKSTPTKYGPANKTGRSEIISEGSDGSEIADVNELDDRADLQDVISSLRGDGSGIE